MGIATTKIKNYIHKKNEDENSEDQTNIQEHKKSVNLLVAFFYLPNLLIFCHFEVYLRFPVYLFNNHALFDHCL